MTVSNQQTEFTYTGNGVTVTFAYSCQVQKASDLQVYVNGAAITIGITKNGIGSLSGGSVTFSVAPASGAAVRLERVVVLERTTDYQQNGDFLARVANSDFDRLWMALQQFGSNLKRALRFPKSDINPVTELPIAAERANKLLGFDSSGNPIVVAPVSGSAAEVAIALANVISAYASSSGSYLIGYNAGVPLSDDIKVQDKLHDLALTPIDFSGLRFISEPEASRPDATQAFQDLFATQYTTVKGLRMPGGFYSVGALYMGDPATEGIYSGSGTQQLVSQFSGDGRAVSIFFARPAASIYPSLLRANNGAGLGYKDFAAFGQGNVATVMDFSFDMSHAVGPAPSNQCEYRNLYATGGVVVGINADNCYDSVFDNIRTNDSPIGLSMVSGGGSVSLTHSTISGLFRIASQNALISKSYFYDGVDVNGAATNYLSFHGCQIFPIKASVSIPSYKAGVAIDCTDAGTYGASLVLESCYLFSAVGNFCIKGKFSNGIRANNCEFTYGLTLFGPITPGNGAALPLMHFSGCTFNGPAGGALIGTNPTTFNWVMENCYVNGVYIKYASNMTEGFWNASISGIAITENVPSIWQRNGNQVALYFDISIPANSSPSSALILGSPFSTAGTVGGAISYGLNTYALPLNGYMSTNQIAPIITSSGLIPTLTQLSGKRIAGVVTFPCTVPWNGV